MSLRARVDPELVPALDGYVAEMGADFMVANDAATRRAKFAAFGAKVAPEEPPFAQIGRRDIAVPSRDAGRTIAIRLYTPPGAGGERAGIFLIHGGGFTLGSIDGEDAAAAALADRLGVAVVSVGYRLAPEHPHPAPIEDCYDALRWMSEHARELAIDPARIGLYGASAGGGLAASLAIMARDLGGPRLAFQMLCYPMLDDRADTPSCGANSGLGVWDAAANRRSWDELLGGGSDASGHAAASRAASLAGLPPAYIDVGELDVLLDEAVAYSAALRAAGVPVELAVHPGAFHGFDLFAPSARVSERAIARRMAVLTGALAPEGNMKVMADRDEDAIMALMAEAYAAYNRGDQAGFRATWSAHVDALLNEAPPYLWSGPTAVEQWLSDGEKTRLANQVEDVRIRLLERLKLQISGDRAHLVVKVRVSYAVAGTPMQQDGWQIVTLERSDGHWLQKAFAYGGEGLKAA